jgi:hypothetical protein
MASPSMIIDPGVELKPSDYYRLALLGDVFPERRGLLLAPVIVDLLAARNIS